MNVFSICISCVVASVLSLLLKKQNAEYSLILTVATATLVITCIMSEILIVVSGIKDIMKVAGVNSDYIVILLKCVGICFLTEFSCDCCKDASQNTLSTVVLISGRICILVAAFPLFEEFLSLSLSLSRGGR